MKILDSPLGLLWHPSKEVWRPFYCQLGWIFLLPCWPSFSDATRKEVRLEHLLVAWWGQKPSFPTCSVELRPQVFYGSWLTTVELLSKSFLPCWAAPLLQGKVFFGLVLVCVCWLSGTLASLPASLGYVRPKESLGNSLPHVVPWMQRSPAGLPSSVFQILLYLSGVLGCI